MNDELLIHPIPARSRWHLSEQQVRQFDQQGFLHLANQIPPVLLDLLQQKADLVRENAHQQLKSNTHGRDCLFSYTYFKAFLNRLLHFHLHAGVDSLAILGCPQVLALAESLCGADLVATVDMMVFKHQQNIAPMPWHQDLIYPAHQHRVATIGLYLDDALESEDALQLVQGSQTKKHDICALIDHPPTNIVRIGAKRGDIVIHNPMMVHCSGDLTSAPLRRTLYYEFRAMQQATTEHTWPAILLQRRLNLIATALAVYQRAMPSQPQFSWNIAKQWRGQSCMDNIKPLYADPIPFNSANFCHSQPL